MIYGERRFDTAFNFFRGIAKSQNDWCVTNAVDSVESFNILPKVSDHTPCLVQITSVRSHSMSCSNYKCQNTLNVL